jgi:hypothetical protein
MEKPLGVVQRGHDRKRPAPAPLKSSTVPTHVGALAGAKQASWMGSKPPEQTFDGKNFGEAPIQA